jgi:hypothetical protein
MAERRASPFILYQQWFRYCAGAKWMNDMAKQPWISTFASRVKEPLEDIPARLAEDATRLRNAVQPLLRAKPRKLSPAAMSALAIGALAIGALAIGFVAIGGMSVGRARIGRLQVDNLILRRRRRFPDPEAEEDIWR